jgi:hypothetical protein
VRIVPGERVVEQQRQQIVVVLGLRADHDRLRLKLGGAGSLQSVEQFRAWSAAGAQLVVNNKRRSQPICGRGFRRQRPI